MSLTGFRIYLSYLSVVNYKDIRFANIRKFVNTATTSIFFFTLIANGAGAREIVKNSVVFNKIVNFNITAMLLNNMSLTLRGNMASVLNRFQCCTMGLRNRRGSNQHYYCKEKLCNMFEQTKQPL